MSQRLWESRVFVLERATRAKMLLIGCLNKAGYADQQHLLSPCVTREV
ncbi:MAG TPA: hypothetical protein VFV38_29545 [Ktedonobacteraceae bacterium]|nr:hypothetical protein [Ktedonobacteraceae bacterium]